MSPSELGQTIKISPSSGKNVKVDKPNSAPYVYSFVTLRSMDGIELLQNAYEEFESPTYRCCIKFWSLCGCCKDKYRRVKMREIDNTWPYP